MKEKILVVLLWIICFISIMEGSPFAILFVAAILYLAKNG